MKFQDGMYVFTTLHKRYNESTPSIGSFANSIVRGNYLPVKVIVHLMSTLYVAAALAYSVYGIYSGMMTIMSLKYLTRK